MSMILSGRRNLLAPGVKGFPSRMGQIGVGTIPVYYHDALANLNVVTGLLTVIAELGNPPALEAQRKALTQIQTQLRDGPWFMDPVTGYNYTNVRADMTQVITNSASAINSYRPSSSAPSTSSGPSTGAVVAVLGLAAVGVWLATK